MSCFRIRMLRVSAYGELQCGIFPLDKWDLCSRANFFYCVVSYCSFVYATPKKKKKPYHASHRGPCLSPETFKNFISSLITAQNNKDILLDGHIRSKGKLARIANSKMDKALDFCTFCKVVTWHKHFNKSQQSHQTLMGANGSRFLCSTEPETQQGHRIL